MKHLHPVLDGLQSDRHLGQHADGLLLRFGLLSDEGTQVAIQHDGGSNLSRDASEGKTGMSLVRFLIFQCRDSQFNKVCPLFLLLYRPHTKCPYLHRRFKTGFPKQQLG